MKKLQKGFSLVELLVVVAIIGVLAGVGIVGYQGYTQSAKERVAVANYNSVKRFIDTELTLLNNNVQTTSASVRTFVAGATCENTRDEAAATAMYDNTLATNTPIEDFLRGIVCYFDIDFGTAGFANPFQSLENQLVYEGGTAAGGLGGVPRIGTINIGLADEAGDRAGVVISDAMAADAVPTTRGGNFIIEYMIEDVDNPGDPIAGAAGESVGQLFDLAQ
jgi:prepilin-type N-terminal cleavage/methylation domain-containing protein